MGKLHTCLQISLSLGLQYILEILRPFSVFFSTLIFVIQDSFLFSTFKSTKLPEPMLPIKALDCYHSLNLLSVHLFI